MVERYFNEETGVASTKGGLSALDGRSSKDDAAEWKLISDKVNEQSRQQTSEFMRGVHQRLAEKEAERRGGRKAGAGGYGLLRTVFRSVALAGLITAATAGLQNNAVDHDAALPHHVPDHE